MSDDYPTRQIRFTATLGALREARSWYLAAYRCESRESVTHQFTAEEAERVLRQPGVFPLVQAVAGLGKLSKPASSVEDADDDYEDAGDAMRIIRKMFRGKTWPEIAEEIGRLVAHDENIQRIAAHEEAGTADSVIAFALTRPSLASALSHVATWDNQRAVRQALRNVGPDDRSGTSHGGLWDTTFEYLFQRVIDKWPPTLQARQVAEQLWDLLDRIDTTSDSIKPTELEDHQLFYRRVLRIAKIRHDILKSDGYSLGWTTLGNKAETEPTPIASPIPVPMLLFCPMCHGKHIDEGEFATKPHHTHACQNWVNGPDDSDSRRRRCGHVWRPAIVPTVGVEALPGFINA